VDPLETFFAQEVMDTEQVTLCATRPAAEALPRTRPGWLYPVLDAGGLLAGVTTHRALLAEPGTVGDATSPAQAVCHPDDTLRTVANALALAEVGAAPVVDRADPTRLLGVVTADALLHARRRDLHEELHRERVLTVLPMIHV
jgi:CBS domain-containing protein